MCQVRLVDIDSPKALSRQMQGEIPKGSDTGVKRLLRGALPPAYAFWPDGLGTCERRPFRLERTNAQIGGGTASGAGSGSDPAIPARVEPHTVVQQISNTREGPVGYETPTWRRD